MSEQRKGEIDAKKWKKRVAKGLGVLLGGGALVTGGFAVYNTHTAPNTPAVVDAPSTGATPEMSWAEKDAVDAKKYALSPERNKALQGFMNEAGAEIIDRYVKGSDTFSVFYPDKGEHGKYRSQVGSNVKGLAYVEHNPDQGGSKDLQYLAAVWFDANGKPDLTKVGWVYARKIGKNNTTIEGADLKRLPEVVESGTYIAARQESYGAVTSLLNPGSIGDGPIVFDDGSKTDVPSNKKDVKDLDSTSVELMKDLLGLG